MIGGPKLPYIKLEESYLQNNKNKRIKTEIKLKFDLLRSLSQPGDTYTDASIYSYWFSPFAINPLATTFILYTRNNVHADEKLKLTIFLKIKDTVVRPYRIDVPYTICSCS
jgi:hypothetical protein